jgi:hypothetical protein
VLVKDCYLAHIVRQNEGKSLIIFTGTKKNCMYVALLLKELGQEVAPHLRPHTLVACTISLRPHTLEAQSLIH